MTKSPRAYTNIFNEPRDRRPTPKHLTFTVTPHTYAKIQHEAARQGVSLSGYVNGVLRAHWERTDGSAS